MCGKQRTPRWAIPIEKRVLELERRLLAAETDVRRLRRAVRRLGATGRDEAEAHAQRARERPAGPAVERTAVQLRAELEGPHAGVQLLTVQRAVELLGFHVGHPIWEKPVMLRGVLVRAGKALTHLGWGRRRLALMGAAGDRKKPVAFARPGSPLHSAGPMQFAAAVARAVEKRDPAVQLGG